MSDIVERLRAWVYTDSLYAVAVEAADEIERLREELSRLRLTDAEREAIKWAASHLDNCGWSSAALRGLLERIR